jgi:hypothetical protein
MKAWCGFDERTAETADPLSSTESNGPDETYTSVSPLVLVVPTSSIAGREWPSFQPAQLA